MSEKLKIRLLENLPIEKKHGARKGRVFEVVRQKKRQGRHYPAMYFFVGDAGEECGALEREVAFVE